MVRIKDRDDLNDVKGRLEADFRDAALTSLHRDFVSTVHTSERSRAEKALETLYQAAQKLRHREHEFNARARTSAASLMNNLRDAGHFSALREFNAAKEGLFDINPQTGRRIVTLVEKNIHPVTPRAGRSPKNH